MIFNERRRFLDLKPQPTPTCFTVGAILICNGAAFEVVGVHLGGVGQTDVIALTPMSETPNVPGRNEMTVPAHVLECAIQGGALFLDDLIATAINQYGDVSSDAVFTTAGVQNACRIATEAYCPNSSDVEALLSKCRRIVRLHGGSYWLRLPADLRRFDEGSHE